MLAARKVLLGAGNGQQEPAILAKTSGTASGASAGSFTTPPINTIGASLLLFTVATYQGFTSVSDSAGNTWTALSTYGGGSNHVGVQSFITVAPITSTAHTFTCTYGATTFAGGAVIAFTGTTGGQLNDLGSANGAGSSTISPGTATTAGKLLYVTGLASGDVNPTVDSGFTIQELVPYAVNNNVGCAVATLIGQQSGSITPTWTVTNEGSSMAANLESFA